MKSPIVIQLLALVLILGTSALGQEITREEREQKIAELKAKVTQRKADLITLKAREDQLRAKLREEHPNIFLERDKAKSKQANDLDQEIASKAKPQSKEQREAERKAALDRVEALCAADEQKFNELKARMEAKQAGTNTSPAAQKAQDKLKRPDEASPQ